MQNISVAHSQKSATRKESYESLTGDKKTPQQRYRDSKKGKNTKKSYNSSNSAKSGKTLYKQSERGREVSKYNNMSQNLAYKLAGGYDNYKKLSDSQKKELRDQAKGKLAQKGITNPSQNQIVNASTDNDISTIGNQLSHTAIADRERFLHSLPQEAQEKIFAHNRQNVSQALINYFNGANTIEEHSAKNFLEKMDGNDIKGIISELTPEGMMNAIALMSDEQFETFSNI